MTSNEELWSSVLGELEISLSRANFRTWFKNTSLFSLEDGEAVVSVPNLFAKEWLEKKYHNNIAEALSNIAGGVKKIEYRIGSPKTLKEDLVKEALVEIEEEEDRPVQTGNLNTKYTFDTFVVGPSNKLAYAAALNVAGKPGAKYNPLFLYGGVGLGKTHLMQAIGNEISKKWPKKKVSYLTAERFTNEFIAGIATRKTNQFKDKYRKVDVLLLDDLHFLAEKESTQEEFFHTFNALYLEEKQIVMTSDRPPKDIQTLEDRLRSRCEGGLLVDIQPPDLETRIAILQRKSQLKGYRVPLEVIDYVARNIQQNVRELEGALTRIIAYCELNDEGLNREVAEAVLKTVLERTRRQPLKPRQIIEKVAEFYDTQPADLLGKKRDKEIVFPRQVGMYIMREELKLSYPKIAAEFGGKDHTTVMHAVSKIEKEIDQNESLRGELALLVQRMHKR